jgi:hypothetical protein
MLPSKKSNKMTQRVTQIGAHNDPSFQMNRCFSLIRAHPLQRDERDDSQVGCQCNYTAICIGGRGIAKPGIDSTCCFMQALYNHWVHCGLLR